jgi:hypothetical protein
MNKKEAAYELQRIDCNCNDCLHMQRDNERLKAHIASYEGTGLMDRLAFGHCQKFVKPVSFVAATCQLETQGCFEHRLSALTEEERQERFNK